MKIVCISDTHGLHDQITVPSGDLLLHAGDHCNHGTRGEVKAFERWLSRQPHPHKVIVAGNHDWPWQKQRRYAQLWLSSATYLQGTGIEIGGLKIWGSPWQPEFCNWAFNLPRGPRLAEVWSQIPEDTDILLTHTPPAGILDAGLGCADLARRLEQLPRLRLHVFGHIHQSHGIERRGQTTFINASVCDADYRPVQAARVLELS